MVHDPDQPKTQFLETTMSLFEREIIQQRLKNTNTPKIIGKLSQKFDLMMEKGNVDRPLKLLPDDMPNGVLSPYDKTLKRLMHKHPNSRELNEKIILKGEKSLVIQSFLKISMRKLLK